MSGFQSLDRAIEILFVFTKRQPKLSADEIAKKANLPRGSIYRYLNALIENRLIERDPASNKFQLGYKLLYFQSVIHYNDMLEDIVQPYMIDINEKTTETVSLTIYKDGMAVPIDSIESNDPVRVAPPPGLFVNLNAGANNKAILAFRPVSEQEKILSGELKKYTDSSLTDPLLLAEELEKIRRDGFAYSHEEMHRGAWGVAVPIIGRDGYSIASVGISGPIFRQTEQLKELSIEMIVKAGTEISEKMQYITQTS